MNKNTEEQGMEDFLLETPLNEGNLSENEENENIERDLMQELEGNDQDQEENVHKKRERSISQSELTISGDLATSKKIKTSQNRENEAKTGESGGNITKNEENIEEKRKNDEKNQKDEEDLLDINEDNKEYSQELVKSEKGKENELTLGKNVEENGKNASKESKENSLEGEEPQILPNDHLNPQKESEKEVELLESEEENHINRWTTGSHWIQGEKLKNLNGIDWKSFTEVRELLVCRRNLSHNRIEEGYSIISNLLNNRGDLNENPKENGNPFIFDRMNEIKRAIECDVAQEKAIRSFIQSSESLQLEDERYSKEMREDLFFLVNNIFIEIRKGESNNYDLMCTLISKGSDIVRVWMDFKHSEFSNGCSFVSSDLEDGREESVKILCSFGDQSSVILFQKTGEEFQLNSSLLSRMKKETGVIDIKDEELFALLWSACLLPSISIDNQSLALNFGWNDWPSVFSQDGNMDDGTVGDVDNLKEQGEEDGEELSLTEEVI
eukprot:TRINITY_DN5298_c0_g1_i1.p1 TRINITY_DN5298_c0_g1~~TRINITY_DN5298_c0_g1_i1.p1  ORF type:complete len:498 (-),score=186.22 TRINITY_DN5298_c0_g1_i1:185-1678(-)